MDISKVPQPTFYLFKCEQGSSLGVKKPSCIDENSQDLFNHMAQSLMLKGIMGPVQAIKTNCLGRCEVGPVMLVEPGHHMYVQLDKEKIDKIIEEHIIGGKPVIEYLISEQLWGEPQIIDRN